MISSGRWALGRRAVGRRAMGRSTMGSALGRSILLWKGTLGGRVGALGWWAGVLLVKLRLSVRHIYTEEDATPTREL